MRGRAVILKKIRQFYGGFKEAEASEQKARYRSGIESLLWALGTPSGKPKDSYLDQIKELYVPLESTAEYEDEFHPSYNIRYFNITKWVTDKKENSLEKLVNVYEVLSNERCNIALVFHRTSINTRVYLAVVNTENANDNVNVENYRRRLLEAIKGNFPGSTVSEEVGRGRIPCLNHQKPYSVATVSNLQTTK